jgi:hypothetical protein
MSGAFARVDEKRVPFTYPSDDNTDYYILMEPKYTEASGLTAITGTPTVPKYPFNHKSLRHIYIRATEDSPAAGRLHSRRVPCVGYTSIDTPAIVTAIDGISGWTWGNVHGETVHI